MNHTPGPWELAYYHKGFAPPIPFEEHGTIAIFTDKSGDIAYLQHCWGDELAKNNAYVIAMAPMMLRVLEDLIHLDFGANGSKTDLHTVAQSARLIVEMALTGKHLIVQNNE